MPDRLNQSQLIARIREELGLSVDSKTIHLMMENGMPYDIRFGKRPRFRWQEVHAWILEVQNANVTDQFTTEAWLRKRQVATPPDLANGPGGQGSK
jgi:hypothetical protein